MEHGQRHESAFAPVAGLRHYEEMSSGPGWDDTEFDRELEEDPGAERNGVHRPNGERILFPAAYTFRTDGPSLHVLDDDGRVAVVFAQGAWEFAISTGAKFKWNWDAERTTTARSFGTEGNLGPERQ